MEMLHTICFGDVWTACSQRQTNKFAWLICRVKSLICKMFFRLSFRVRKGFLKISRTLKCQKTLFAAYECLRKQNMCEKKNFFLVVSFLHVPFVISRAQTMCLLIYLTTRNKFLPFLLLPFPWLNYLSFLIIKLISRISNINSANNIKQTEISYFASIAA